MNKYCVYYIRKSGETTVYFADATSPEEAISEVKEKYPEQDVEIVVDECKENPYKIGGCLQ